MDIAAILTANYPGTQWALNGFNYDGLEWLDESPKPSEAELAKLWPEVEYAEALREVRAARLARFNAESDPIFFQYQRGERTEQEWLDAVALVESELPLPSKSK